MMTLSHARKSAVTYANGALAGMIFDLSFGDVDDDGNAAGNGQPQKGLDGHIG